MSGSIFDGEFVENRLSGKDAVPDPASRRGFLTSLTGWAMALGVIASYGTFAAILGRFVYPTKARNRAWLFVCTVADLPPGKAVDFVAPSGARVVIAHQRPGEAADDFLALSSVCPHLGCRVHWEGPQERFFCPCHNGAFDRSGLPIAGPPLASKQPLSRFPLKVENHLLYIEAPLTALALDDTIRGHFDPKGIA